MTQEEKRPQAPQGYAFLMIKYKTPDYIKELHDKIKPSELFTDPDDTKSYNQYGLEKETHVTLVPCLENEVAKDINKLKKMLRPLNDYRIVVTNISMFDNGKFDVLKSNVFSQALHQSNSEIKKKFTTHSTYDAYEPHVTVAYLKKGKAKKYTKDCMIPLLVLEPEEFHFSYYDEDGNEKDIFWK